MEPKQQPMQFPSEEEINEVIDKNIDTFFSKNNPKALTTLFSKEIEEWKKETKHSQQEINMENLKNIVSTKYKKMAQQTMTDIAKYDLFKGKIFKLNNTHQSSTTLSTELEDKNLNIELNDFSKTLDNIVDKQHVSPSTSFIPERCKFIQKKNNNVFYNKLHKTTNSENIVGIGNIFFNLQYDNEKEYNELGKNNNTRIYFRKGDNNKIDNICIKVSYNINNVYYENITEIKLENNKISQIEEYNCVDEQIVGTITTINNQDDIAQKIKQIFGNKNDIAIQNILHELDEEQLKAITNNHEINISTKSSSPDLDSNGYCPCNNCNCNLDCLNCFSGIFNSKN